MSLAFNKHHILFNRTTWESNCTSRSLREKSALIVPIELEAHKALHKDISIVPLPDPFMSGRVLRDFVGVQGDPLKSIDLLAMSIERAMEHEKANDLDFRLGELAVDAILAQREFIRYGQVSLGAVRGAA